ncbi:MAG: hypothetical protein ABIK19_02040 [candidate division WOR-3 bacterium]
MSSLFVKKVETKKELDDFVRLPWKIYQNDPNWVPPLIADVKNTLDITKNPFFKHAERELFIVYRENEVVGRVAAIVDYNYCQYHNKNVGFFGFFETINDYEVVSLLFSEVIKCLKDKNMNLVYGPANPSLNDEVGFLVDGFDLPPMIKTMYNPRYYLELVEKFGFTKIKDLYAYLIEVQREPPEKVVRVVDSIKKKTKITVRPVNLKNLKQDLIKIKEIYNNAWSKNWDFAPMTDEEIDYLAKQLKDIVVPEIVPIVEIDGEPAGMSIGLPDYNQVLKHLNGRLFPFGFIKFLLYKNKINAARLWALGVKDKFRNLGVDALLYYETFVGAKRKGYQYGEVSWILEDNVSIINPILLWGAKLYKTYRVYQLTI